MNLRNAWKESANVLVLTPTDNSYSVLTVRGNHYNNLKVKSYVTPGGTVDYSDFSSKWWLIFDNFESNSDSFEKSFSGFTSSRPPIITDNILLEELRRSSSDEGLLVTTDMALRIAAIRHLFVQTGILIVEGINKIGLSSDIREMWRQSVSQSSVNFYKMCEELHLKPDLSSLKEWWNWLTPSSVGSLPRFDTIYYICFVNNVLADESQHWSTPQRLIERRDDYFLAPPQVYEFSRLNNFQNIKEVEVFATKRQKYGTQRWIPLISLYSNGALSLLPGDDLYPDDVELIATKPVRTYPQSLEEIKRKSIHMNRMELKGTDCKVVVNIDMPLNHIRPVAQNERNYFSDLIFAKL